MNPLDLEIYVVRNHKGEFFRAKGYSGTGNSFVTDINKARIYGKLGPARSIVTYFAKNHPKYDVLEIIKMKIGGFEVLDETKRVEKVLNAAQREKLATESRNAKRQLDEAQRRLDEAQRNLDKLKKQS